jgi:hypothetical protein
MGEEADTTLARLILAVLAVAERPLTPPEIIAELRRLGAEPPPERGH